MYDHPFDRKFGIEFEFACPVIGTLNHPSAVRGDYDRNGRPSPNGVYDRYGYRVQADKYSIFRAILKENGMSDFVVGADGSEFEIKTPILQGPTGFKRVKRFLDLLESFDARISLNHDGLHVHHDAPEFYNAEFGAYRSDRVVRLVENWVNNQNEIFPMVNSIRHGRMSCYPWTHEEAINLKRNFDHYIGRFGRKNLNIASLRRHGTIEIRLHEGTLNYEEILSWVRFGQSFIGKAVEERDGNVVADNADDLLRKIKVSRNASRFLSRKANPVVMGA